MAVNEPILASPFPIHRHRSMFYVDRVRLIDKEVYTGSLLVRGQLCHIPQLARWLGC